MNRLLFVRHGQACYGTANYDELSPLGMRQSRRLGRSLARSDIAVDAIWTGPLQRQRDTARGLVAAAAEQERLFPEPRVVTEFSELPTLEIFKCGVLHLIKKDAALRGLLGLGRETGEELDALQIGARTPREVLMPILSRILVFWARGMLEVSEEDSFAAFERRVQRGLASVMDAVGGDRCIVVVTSAGPIALALRQALGFGAERAMRLTEDMANGALTELRVSKSAIRLISFNSVSHLDPADVTVL
jgi:broad specificity phosphatase PhoE